MNHQRVQQLFELGRSRGIIQVALESERLDGRTVRVRGKELVNFGSCSYLGLELDQRLVRAGMDALERYGTQYSSSRCYASVSLYSELENLMEQITGRPCLVAPTTTLGHLAALPNLVMPNDAVLLDMYVHNSVHMACALLRQQGCRFASLPSTELGLVARKLETLCARYERVWFLMDGLYSMHGHHAPFGELSELLERHPRLHIYCDDAHSAGWFGTRGQGAALAHWGQHPRVVVALSLCKSFGGTGGVVALPTRELAQRVRDLGQPFIFSGPVPPALLGANIASARLHLSSELEALQGALMRRIEHFNKAAVRAGLRLHNTSMTPIRFIELGTSEYSIEVTQRLQQAGFFTNCAVYPAVPDDRAGLRIALTNHLHLDDISALIEAVASIDTPTVRLPKPQAQMA